MRGPSGYVDMRVPEIGGYPEGPIQLGVQLGVSNSESPLTPCLGTGNALATHQGLPVHSHNIIRTCKPMTPPYIVHIQWKTPPSSEHEGEKKHHHGRQTAHCRSTAKKTTNSRQLLLIKWNAACTDGSSKIAHQQQTGGYEVWQGSRLFADWGLAKQWRLTATRRWFNAEHQRGSLHVPHQKRRKRIQCLEAQVRIAALTSGSKKSERHRSWQQSPKSMACRFSSHPQGASGRHNQSLGSSSNRSSSSISSTSTSTSTSSKTTTWSSIP